MSTSALPPDRRIGMRLRFAARAAVWVAHLLALLPPHRIRAVLAFLRRGAAPADQQTARRARDAVLSVSLACVNAQGCLPRSLATVLLCRMSGMWPAWCVGPSRSRPIRLHAWVEAEGRAVDEPFPDGYFAKLITVPPG
jgi:hypothetical protein